jgi:hypothetical protein
VNRPQTIYYIITANCVEAFRIVPRSKYVLSTFISHIIFVVFLMEFFTSSNKITNINKYPILIIQFQVFLICLGLPNGTALRCCTLKNKWYNKTKVSKF